MSYSHSIRRSYYDMGLLEHCEEIEFLHFCRMFIEIIENDEELEEKFLLDSTLRILKNLISEIFVKVRFHINFILQLKKDPTNIPHSYYFTLRSKHYAPLSFEVPLGKVEETDFVPLAKNMQKLVNLENKVAQ